MAAMDDPLGGPAPAVPGKPGSAFLVVILALLVSACGGNGGGSAAPAPPVITSFVPDSGSPGTMVTIQGTGFTGVSQVLFAGQAAPTFQEQGGVRITVPVPAAAATGPISVTTAAGTHVSTAPFIVVLAPPPSPGPPAVSGFAPVTGAPGTQVTVTGTGFTGATQVAFGGLACVNFLVASDTTLSAVVPPGAATGPVTVTTPLGSGASAGIFTVPAPAPGPAPVIAAYNPVMGVPGTEVILDGSHFTGAIEVTYAGAALGPDRYDVDSDTSIRVRVPDQATVNGVLGVVTPAGSAVTPGAFTVLPSRTATFTQPFVGVLSTATGSRMLDFPAERRTDQYAFLQYPQTPIFHAYDPVSVPPGNRADVTFATFTLDFQLPAPFYEVIPASVQAQIAALNLDPARVDILCVSQDYAYDGVSGTDGIYLFRPHYWTDPLAPDSGSYNTASNVGVGLFEQEPGIRFAGQAPGAFLYAGISVHSAAFPAVSQVLSSPNNLKMGGFNIANSTGFWSLTQLNDRAAATLHLFFNDADQAALAAIASSAQNLAQLMSGLNGSPLLAGTRGVAMLSALARPVINQGVRAAVPANGVDLLTLTGTSLGGATSVTLAGVPVPRFQVVSDAILKVTVPGGATGSLVVTTPMGASTPTPAP